MLLLPAAARGGDQDLVLSRLGTVQQTGGNITDVTPHNEEFRSLISELGVLIAPDFLAPADTLGYSGFQFSTQLTFNTISASESFWSATQESATGEIGKETDLIPTFGFWVRKGIWLPLPSFELGAGAEHILESNMWAAQAYAKFALHEGFHNWPLPSLAVRGATSRLMGTEQLDLTVASVDVSISKAFGIEGTVRFEPYAGWNYLWIVPRSEVIDATPTVDAFDPGSSTGTNSDVNANFVFPTQDNITRQRLFVGFKLKYYVFTVIAEGNWIPGGSSVDDRAGVLVACGDPGANPGDCDATDRSGMQQSYALSVGLDF